MPLRLICCATYLSHALACWPRAVLPVLRKGGSPSDHAGCCEPEERGKAITALMRVAPTVDFIGQRPAGWLQGDSSAVRLRGDEPERRQRVAEVNLRSLTRR